MKIHSAKIIFPGKDQPIAIVEQVGGMTKSIHFEDMVENSRLWVTKQNIVDGSEKIVYINLRNAMWYEIDEKAPIAQA